MWTRVKLILEWLFDHFIYPLIESASLSAAARKSGRQRDARRNQP